MENGVRYFRYFRSPAGRMVGKGYAVHVRGVEEAALLARMDKLYCDAHGMAKMDWCARDKSLTLSLTHTHTHTLFFSSIAQHRFALCGC